VRSQAVALALAGASCIAFSAVLVRLADQPPSTSAFYRCLYALPVLLALALWERRRFGPRGRRSLAFSWLAGAFFAADLILWHHAIAAVGAGLSTVLANVQVVLVGLVAWAVLKERPEARVFAAVPVVLIGVVLISGVVGADAYGADPGLGVVFGLATAVAYAGFLLVLREGNRDTRRPAGPLFDATLAATIAILPTGWLLGELDLRPTWPEHAWLVILALTSQVLGWLLISGALPRAPAVLTSVVLTVQPVMSVLLGIVLLGESPSSVQLAGIAVVIGGILLATVGRRSQAREQTGFGVDLT
jgi:drug/metabolite transporter (DMT)-like permease